MSLKLPIPIFSWVIYYGIGTLILAMLVRVIASWFGMDERNAFIRFLAHLTDPFINPFRKIMPRVGIIDLSFFMAWFALGIIQTLLLQSLPATW